jgi:hypothetical protein
MPKPPRPYLPSNDLSGLFGSLILQEVPYPFPSYPNANRPLPKKIYGPGSRFHARHAFKVPNVKSKKAKEVDKTLTTAKANKIVRAGLFWDIGGAKRRMSKAIRIPYTYYDPVDKKNVKTAIVIGYEGSGGGC